MSTKKVRVAAVQLRPVESSVKKTIFQAVKLAKKAAEREADIICLPEHWVPEAVIPPPMDPLPGFQALAEDFDVSIVAGAFFEKVKGRIYLSSPVIGPGGRILGRQFKVHLFHGERKFAKPGNGYQIFKVKGRKVGILVCYDVDFPEVSRIFALNGAELLLCPSRIITEGIVPWQHYLTVRSLENRIPIVAPNIYAPPRFAGHSTIVSLRQDPKTKIALPKILSVSKRGEEILLEDVDLELHNRLRRARFADRRPETYN